MDELGSLKESADEIKNRKEPLPSVPLDLFSRGISKLPAIEGEMPLENIWQDMQKEITSLDVSHGKSLLKKMATASIKFLQILS